MDESVEQPWEQLDTVSCGDTPAMMTELANLVLDGRKRATCWAAMHGTATHVGKKRVLLDGDERPRAILQTTELSQLRFCDVDEAFARDEGEGDLTLHFWRREHEAFFKREGTYAPNMLVYCERFKLVQVIDR